RSFDPERRTFKARQSEDGGDEGYKPATRVDEEGYREGVSATGMFVKPRYNKKFAVNQDKITDPSEMPEIGVAEAEAVLREDRVEGKNSVKEALAAGRTVDKLWVLRPSDGRFDKSVMDI